MATLAELRDRSDELFTELLQAQTRHTLRRGTPLSAAAEPAAAGFSWFDPDDAVAAASLAFTLSALAASGEKIEDSLGAALDHVDEERKRAHPEQVRQGFALFVTHNQDGRRLAKPRTVAAAPELFSPPRAGRPGVQEISVGGPSPGLDYWREDVLANEHHQHWHEVYPYTGLPPRRFDEWLAGLTTDEIVAILEAIDPSQQWADIIPGATPAQLAGLFAQVFEQGLARELPAEPYGKLFRLNDRQGELFFYMHQQMLARYDAELLSNGLERVEPYGPDAWGDPIAAGHDPIEVPGFGRREPETTLPANGASVLQALWHEIDEALAADRLRGPNGPVPIDATNLGEAVEATVSQLRELAEDAYGGLHNTGHGYISQLAEPGPGVMTSTVTAIRDPVFWQWHKCVDDLNARWQTKLSPYDFADSPPVLLRNALDAAAADTAWSSPDIILCRTEDLPTGADPAELGTELFGGANWSADFAAATASANGTSLQTIDQLTTKMAKANFGGSSVWYLTHEPFSYFLRIENTAANPVAVTIRVFLVPADQASDRRSWLEMDKFLVELPEGEKVVVYRPDTESSIVKRPNETSPAAVTEGGSGPDENSYCDCGWPYTLLLPRGKAEGMPFRLLVLCTDAGIDRVVHQEHCGSMSYCGTVDRYPDTRDMGYPFSRPFAGPEATAIQDKIAALDCASARTVTIRHG